jgi:hypothetical protein
MQLLRKLKQDQVLLLKGNSCSSLVIEQDIQVLVIAAQIGVRDPMEVMRCLTNEGATWAEVEMDGLKVRKNEAFNG